MRLEIRLWLLLFLAGGLEFHEHVGGAVIGAAGAALVAREIFHFHGQADFALRLVLAEERSVFHAADADESPLVEGHGVDEEGFGFRVRLQVVVESGEEVIKGGLVFTRENDMPAGEAVFGAILRDALFTFRRLRAGGFLGVEAVGLDLFAGCHYGFDGSRGGEQGGMIGDCELLIGWEKLYFAGK